MKAALIVKRYHGVDADLRVLVVLNGHTVTRRYRAHRLCGFHYKEENQSNTILGS